MGRYWNDKDVRHFEFDMREVVDPETFYLAIARGLGYTRDDETVWKAIADHTCYMECSYHYHFTGWAAFAERMPKWSKRLLRFLRYPRKESDAFHIHLS